VFAVIHKFFYLFYLYRVNNINFTFFCFYAFRYCLRLRPYEMNARNVQNRQVLPIQKSHLLFGFHLKSRKNSIKFIQNNNPNTLTIAQNRTFVSSVFPYYAVYFFLSLHDIIIHVFCLFSELLFSILLLWKVFHSKKQTT